MATNLNFRSRIKRKMNLWAPRRTSSQGTLSTEDKSTGAPPPSEKQETFESERFTDTENIFEVDLL